MNASPIRIARILGRPNVGGPARTVLHLARRLATRGFETLVITGACDEGEADLFASEDLTGLRIERIPELRRSISLADLTARRKIAELLREFRPHVVHTHAAKAGALGRQAAFAIGDGASRPVVVHTYHGHSLTGYFPAPLSALFAAVERRLAKRTDRLIAVSETVRREIALVHRVAPLEQIDVIENGIDLTPFREPTEQSRAVARRALGAREGVPQLVVPARLVPIKGHDLLFAALRILGDSGLACDVHLLGDGSLRASLESAARTLPAAIAVRFHGFRNDVPSLLPAADLVLLTSRNEGMSLALIEAMAAGRAVVATAVGGTPDLIRDGETGILAPPSDAPKLAAAIRDAIADPDVRDRIGSAARAAAIARHAIERVVVEHERLYRELAEPDRPRP